MTGHPVVTLHFACSEKDCAFFVYLSDVTPDGRSIYVTEGVFRALHRAPGGHPRYLPATGPTHSFDGKKYPSLKEDVHVCDAILHLASVTNGELAYRSYKNMEEKPGMPLIQLAEKNRGVRVSFSVRLG